MNCLYLIAVLFILQPIYCQIPKKDGDIIVEVITHALTTAKDITTADKSSTVFYFGKRGLLQEKVHYIKVPNNQPDYVEAYTYKKDKPVQMVKWVNGDSKLKPLYETKYVYDREERLTDASVFYAGKRSVFAKVVHEYDSIGNNIKTIREPDDFLEKAYTKDRKLEGIRQIHADTLKWECNFMYKDNFRTGTFSSQYNDSNSFIKEEIIINGKTRNRYTSNSSTDDKTKYYYDETGLLEKTEYYTYSASSGYVLQSYTNIKVTGNVNQELVKKINEVIVE
ncbi:hypothetical protein Q765_19040 [Flavobacterium rivuli WB 3.3-2 = DSM 21788]|uniref:Uncharacterized protein n=1 Tax=Flavobacterium rivuli WB 3.3-2 = DSM 21788 TaxID=1121895 RepID=A0A0A2M9F0_9FLAO|nr:hypothetical protein [Flavobacterium rivuli]KGO84925.1 hypothetical protein Q765_19040 [Flavobacterium rivuli WB 3.3-2 = DSM 21788]